MKIIIHPNPLLREKSKPITVFDDELKKYARELTRTMLLEDGLGLASIQVGKPIRLLTIFLEDKKDYPSYLTMPLVIANPDILQASMEQEEMEEACLSVPELTGPVTRPMSITVVAQDLNGDTMHIDADGLLARVLQHEIDHLNGTLFIDRVTDHRLLRKIKTKKNKKNLNPKQ